MLRMANKGTLYTDRTNPYSQKSASILKILHYPTQMPLTLDEHMPGSPVDGEILTIKHVAIYLKVTERTIYRLAAAKRIPAFKVGGTWRFSRADIDRWISEQSLVVQGSDPLGSGRGGH